ncbi:MAG: LPS export ABC transporter periplasmic protein LptC [Nitrospirae bacterium]|nr:LPS export ABC transporter periplasmic protein LptC [Nitrospirota bacterium]
MKGKFVFIVSALLALGIVLILGYEDNEIKTTPSHRTSSVQGFRITNKEGNKTQWELTANKAEFQEGEKEILLKDITLKLQHNNEIILTGSSGIYNIQNSNLAVNKPVEVNMDFYKLTTDSLLWNGSEELITTKDDIKLIGKTFLIEGSGLSATMGEQKVRVLSDVKAQFYR